MKAWLRNPDFWARHFEEVEDPWAMKPLSRYAARLRGNRCVTGLRCFWLDGRREWLMEFVEVSFIGTPKVWLYGLYELDVIERYQMLHRELAVELYWRRHRDWREVPWVERLVKQAIMMEALK